MNEAKLETALMDLVDAIRNITLGSVENNVIEAAGTALINSWNSHNDGKIDEAAELENWKKECLIILH